MFCFEQGRGWGNSCHCHVSHIAATVGHVVAALGCALDTMGVQRDEEGFTPPGHVENGTVCVIQVEFQPSDKPNIG